MSAQQHLVAEPSSSTISIDKDTLNIDEKVTIGSPTKTQALPLFSTNSAGGRVKPNKGAFLQCSIQKRIKPAVVVPTTVALATSVIEEAAPTTAPGKQRTAHAPKVAETEVNTVRTSKPKVNQNSDVVGSIIKSSTRPPSTTTYKPFVLPVPALNQVQTVYVPMNIIVPQGYQNIQYPFAQQQFQQAQQPCTCACAHQNQPRLTATQRRNRRRHMQRMATKFQRFSH